MVWDKTERFRMRHFRFLLFSIVCVGVVWGTADEEEVPFAQESTEIVKTVSAEKHPLFAIPAAASLIPGTYDMEGITLVIEKTEDNVKLEARLENDVTVEQWISDTDPYARFVFNPEKNDFERLTNSIRIELDDYDKLDELVEDTEAENGRAFPQLGYAIIQLPETVHPVEYIENVRTREGVQSVTVEVEKPRNFPL